MMISVFVYLKRLPKRMEQEYDMPKASMDKIKQAFFSPSEGAGRPKSA